MRRNSKQTPILPASLRQAVESASTPSQGNDKQTIKSTENSSSDIKLSQPRNSIIMGNDILYFLNGNNDGFDLNALSSSTAPGHRPSIAFLQPFQTSSDSSRRPTLLFLAPPPTSAGSSTASSPLTGGTASASTSPMFATQGRNSQVYLLPSPFGSQSPMLASFAGLMAPQEYQPYEQNNFNQQIAQTTTPQKPQTKPKTGRVTKKKAEKTVEPTGVKAVLRDRFKARLGQGQGSSAPQPIATSPQGQQQDQQIQPVAFPSFMLPSPTTQQGQFVWALPSPNGMQVPIFFNPVGQNEFVVTTPSASVQETNADEQQQQPQSQPQPQPQAERQSKQETELSLPRIKPTIKTNRRKSTRKSPLSAVTTRIEADAELTPELEPPLERQSTDEVLRAITDPETPAQERRDSEFGLPSAFNPRRRVSARLALRRLSKMPSITNSVESGEGLSAGWNNLFAGYALPSPNPNNNSNNPPPSAFPF